MKNNKILYLVAFVVLTVLLSCTVYAASYDLPLPDGKTGEAYAKHTDIDEYVGYDVTISEMTLVSGTMPDGITLSFSGSEVNFEGVPTTAGNYDFVIRVKAHLTMIPTIVREADIHATITVLQGVKNGFFEEDGKLYFYENDIKATGWFEVDGVKYYASSSTNVVINYSKKISGKYYVWNDETGLEIADGFVFDGTGYKCYEDGINVIGWRHADGSGPKVVNGISEQYSSNPEGLYYFLSTTGYMVTDATYKLGGYIREFNEDHTVKAMNGLQTNGGELYYYVDGVKQTGWHTIDGTTYYFRASDAVYGRAATKWMYIGNKVYYFYASTSATPYALKNEGKIGGIEYTYHEDGYILYNGFVNCDYANAANSNTAANIQKMNGTTRYYKNGEMQTGWQNIGGNWYYFYAIGSANGSGYMCVQSRTIGGVWYEFTETGVCTNK